MIGRIGTAFGEHGVNIDAAAVGTRPTTTTARARSLAVMVVTTDAVVRQDVVDGIVAGDGFVDGRAVALT